MLQRKIINLLIIIVIIQGFSLAYFQREIIKSFYYKNFSKENLKSVWDDIRGQFSSSESPSLSDIEKVPLRKFKLTVMPSDWRRINQNLTQFSQRTQIPATLEVDGETYECKVRISKGGPRHWKGTRKSIRLRFPPANLYHGMREVNLNIPETSKVIIDPVAWDFAKIMGLTTPEFDFIKLEINGQNHGVRLFYEDIDKYFLERNGLMGYIFTEKGGAFPFHYISSNDKDYSTVKVINKKGNTLDELRWLNKVLSYPSLKQFREQIVKMIDAQQILTWHSNALLCGSGHQNIHNIKLFYNSALQKFQFFPWDIAGFGHWQHEPRKMWAMDLDWGTNRFIFRLNQIPEFVEQRNHILWKYLQGELTLDNQLSIVDKYYKKIRYHIYVDEQRQASENRFSNKEFEDSIVGLKDWIKLRYNYILDELEKADLRVSVNPLISSFNNNLSKNFVGSNSFVKDGLIISLGTGKQSGVRIKSLKVPLVKKRVNIKNIKLFLDNNANNVLDKGDREIKVLNVKSEPSPNNEAIMVKIVLDELLLPARNVYYDPYFDYVDKGYMLQTHPFYRYYNFIVAYISDSNNKYSEKVFDTDIRLECNNSITGTAIQPEYFTTDKEKIFALTYKENILSTDNDSFVNNKIFTQERGLKEQTIELTTYLKKLKNKTPIIIPAGKYTLTENWEINEEEVVIISAGTHLKINPGISIFVKGVLNINGTPDSPVILENALEGQPWGCLAYYNTTQNSRLSYVKIRGAGMGKLGNVNFTGGVSAYNATVVMNSCVFENIRADDGFNAKNSQSRLINCQFIQTKDDAIDYDLTEGEIKNCYIYKPGGDGIDCGEGASPQIIGNFIEYPNDKCISVGEASSPTIENNFLIGGVYGIAIKDDSKPLVRNDTICKNKIGISFYIKKPKEFGCPTALIEKCIIWDNDKSIENLCDADFILRKSAIMGGYDGEKIFTEPPVFDVDSNGNKYLQKKGSIYAIKGFGAQRGIF